jgi:spermidine/putrescine transport system substrate-binding protein/spermidine/putrescine transport system permease protein
VLAALSFNNSRFSSIWQGFSWRWYKVAWNDKELISTLRISLLVALVTTVISSLIGSAAALALARYKVRFKRAAEGAVLLPVIIPEIVIGFSTAGLFGALGIAFGLGTLISAHVAFSIPFVIFIVRARASNLDATLEEAAMDLGANRWQTFLKVTLPLLMPGIISAALLVFTISLDDYVITSFVAGPAASTIPLKIYSMVKTGVTPEINAISTLLLGATLALVFASERLGRGKLSRPAIIISAGAFVLLLGFALGGQRHNFKGGELNIYIWSNYLPDDVIAEFEKRFDAKVNIELYDSNEALLAKLQSGSVSFDIVVPSDYMVAALKAQGMLSAIDRDRLSNFSNLDPRFVGFSYDAENEFSIPYMWGTTGIGYRKDKVSEPVDSWAALWDERYTDRLAMLDDVREVLGAALKYMGKSLNTVDAGEIRAAAQLLEKQKPMLRAYDSGGFDQMLLSGDAWIAQAYSGQIAKAMAEDSNIGYAIPKEGCTLFIDNLCIPQAAAHPDLAMEFINFALDGKVAADIANGTGFSSPNLAAKAFIRPDLLANEAAYPPREALDRCELIMELGPAISIYDRYWTEIKSR